MALKRTAMVLTCILFGFTVVYLGIARKFLARQTDIAPPLGISARNWALGSDPKNNIVDSETPRKKLPQVIGIGAKKCGTGALRHFLAKHSKVKMPTVTEPHFFDGNLLFKKGLSRYLSMMPVTSGDELTIEITPKYFVDDNVPGRIKELYGEQRASRLKFVVIFCNPVDRLFSEYVHTMSAAPRFDLNKRVRLYKSVSDLIGTALPNLTAELRKLGRAPSANESRAFSDYLGRNREVTLVTNGVYALHFKRWFSHFSPSQFLVVNGDLLIAKPWVAMNDVQDFLGVERTITKEDFHFDTDKGFYCLGKCLQGDKGRTRSRKRLVNKHFPPLTETVRRTLEEIYRPYNAELFTMLNRTLRW